MNNTTTIDNTKQRFTSTGIRAVAERNSLPTRVRPLTPAAFRRQESFWNDVKRHIVERQPGGTPPLERLY